MKVAWLRFSCGCCCLGGWFWRVTSAAAAAQALLVCCHHIEVGLSSCELCCKVPAVYDPCCLLALHIAHRHNYFGTQGLMQLSSQFLQLRSFVHVSTYFVNNHMPRNSVVKEQLNPVPLELDGRPVEYKEFVDALMAMSTEDANKTALDLMTKNNFNSTYAFGKHLTERMVVDTEVKPGVQRAMVRPSLIAALLGDPYPG